MEIENIIVEKRIEIDQSTEENELTQQNLSENIIEEERMETDQNTEEIENEPARKLSYSDIENNVQCFACRQLGHRRDNKTCPENHQWEKFQ